MVSTPAPGASAFDQAPAAIAAQVKQEGLTREDYNEIVRRLGRHPNRAELGMFGDNVDSHLTYGAGFTLRSSSGIAIGVDFSHVPFQYLGQTSTIDIKLYY